MNANAGRPRAGIGWNFKPGRLQAVIEQLKAENALRVQCPHCPLMILDMATHLRICHSPD